LCRDLFEFSLGFQVAWDTESRELHDIGFRQSIDVCSQVLAREFGQAGQVTSDVSALGQIVQNAKVLTGTFRHSLFLVYGESVFDEPFDFVSSTLMMHAIAPTAIPWMELPPAG
jgi:hypothetical protein